MYQEQQGLARALSHWVVQGSHSHFHTPGHPRALPGKWGRGAVAVCPAAGHKRRHKRREAKEHTPIQGLFTVQGRDTYRT